MPHLTYLQMKAKARESTDKTRLCSIYIIFPCTSLSLSACLYHKYQLCLSSNCSVTLILKGQSNFSTITIF
ncbi:hypothetical protein XELAEV_18036206mg [Xenopus laevis]|uniref:Uncharacterized protein n=1 Tax=Xenopus laevis TaxID=8355 RepID=A0A974CJ60_XENLA|nr:hypothetical protein XELAEV_18036206mg [Xenopus laevis]